AHRTLAIIGRAARPFGDLEGWLVATERTPELVLGQLLAALLVMCESLRHVPGVFGFPWEILVCTAVVGLIDWTSDTASEALMLPVGEARPPTLQTLSLSTLNGSLSWPSLGHTVEFLKERWKNQPPKFSQRAGTRSPPVRPTPSPGRRLETWQRIGKNTFFYQKGSSCNSRKRMTALDGGKAPQAEESKRSPQAMLAKVESKFQPFLSGPATPAAPPAAPRGPEVTGPLLAPQLPQERGGHTGRALRPVLTCRFDSASQRPDHGHPQPQQICLCFLP
ncbi:hypothetical protein HPG69_007877, partial [Diceros bicornis minor]